AVGKLEVAVACLLAVHPLARIALAVGPDVGAGAVGIAVAPLAFVLVLVEPAGLALTVEAAVLERALEAVAVGEGEHALAVHEARLHLAFILLLGRLLGFEPLGHAFALGIAVLARAAPGDGFRGGWEGVGDLALGRGVDDPFGRRAAVLGKRRASQQDQEKKDDAGHGANLAAS